MISAAARCAFGHIRAAELVRPSVGKISIAYAGAGSLASSTALRNAAFSSSAPAWPSRYRIDSKTAPLAAPGCRGRRRPQRSASAANCIESTSAANAGVETRDAQVHRPRSRRCEWDREHAVSALQRVAAFDLDLMWSTRLRSRALAKDPRRAEDDERLDAPQQLCEREGRGRRVQRKGVERTRVAE